MQRNRMECLPLNLLHPGAQHNCTCACVAHCWHRHGYAQCQRQHHLLRVAQVRPTPPTPPPPDPPPRVYIMAPEMPSRMYWPFMRYAMNASGFTLPDAAAEQHDGSSKKSAAATTASKLGAALLLCCIAQGQHLCCCCEQDSECSSE